MSPDRTGAFVGIVSSRESPKKAFYKARLQTKASEFSTAGKSQTVLRPGYSHNATP